MARTFLALSLVTCATFAGLHAQSQPAGSPQGRTNTVFVTAMEENGAPVVDLVASDFTIKENGKNRDVLKVELARVPMQIAIIVDDNGTGIFRSGLVSFVQLLQGRAEMSLSSVVGQTQKLVEYTPHAEKVVCSKAFSRRRKIRRNCDEHQPAVLVDVPGLGQLARPSRTPA